MSAAEKPTMHPGVTLYVVRHGETDWNAAQKLQGQTDIPINERGRGQAARNGVALRAVLAANPDLDFISSPLARTVETMDIVRRELGLPAKRYALDDRLKEIAFGIWEGSTWAQIDGFVDATGKRRAEDPYHWQPEGGESYAQLAHRVAGWLDSITRSAIVVTHGGVTRVLRGQVLGLPTTEVASLPVPQDKILMLRAGGGYPGGDRSVSMHWL
jgi:broad specificity phosphatase PhoE